MPIVVKTPQQKKFVHYDDDGKIIGIKNKKDEGVDAIQVPIQEIEDIIRGKIPSHQFRVEYDFVIKKFMVKQIEAWNESKLVKNFLFEIPKHGQDDVDVKIIQDIPRSKWVLKFNHEIYNSLEKMKIKIDNALTGYSITEETNPYKLVKVLNFNNAVSVDKTTYELDFEFDKTDLSIYTIKKFSSYQHEVINE
jgi:hypothetical protein